MYKKYYTNINKNNNVFFTMEKLAPIRELQYKNCPNKISICPLGALLCPLRTAQALSLRKGKALDMEIYSFVHAFNNQFFEHQCMPDTVEDAKLSQAIFLSSRRLQSNNQAKYRSIKTSSNVGSQKDQGEIHRDPLRVWTNECKSHLSLPLSPSPTLFSFLPFLRPILPFLLPLPLLLFSISLQSSSSVYKLSAWFTAQCQQPRVLPIQGHAQRAVLSRKTISTAQC